MKQITKAEFTSEVLQSKTPVLVDFFTDQCTPCKQIAPLLEEAERESAGQLKIVKVNAAEENELATTWRISGVPTLLLFRNGQCVGQRVGMASKKMLQMWIADLVRQ